ncbi:MAG: DUF1320 domain-containing protein [Sphingomonadales bacterium]|nr:MAG: DUF1320 domain-containing protein [Sphingomonadales bacterium]
MITQADYEARFGVDELLRVSDPQRTGAVDPETFAAAVTAASALIEAHLGVRYALPITPVPALILDVAADLTRERLHGERVSELILERGRQARRVLGDLAAGRMALNGTAAPRPGGGAAPSVRPGLTTLTDALKDF